MESCLCRTVKETARGDKVLILPVVNGFIPLVSLLGCVHVIPPVWRLAGLKPRGILMARVGAASRQKLFEPWLVHFLHFDASCRRLHWLAGSPLKLRPLSSRSVRTRSTKTHLACCKRKQPSVRPTALSPETDCLYPFRICCIPFLFRN